MSEPNQKTEGGGISEALNKKWGPIPVWVYLVVIGLAIFLFIYLRRQKSASSTTDTTGTTSAATTPPFVNQVYTNTSPPEESTPGQPSNAKAATKIIELKTPGTFDAIAKRWHMTVDQLIRLNPDLANKYENTKKRLPKGTKIRVLEQNGGGGTLH